MSSNNREVYIINNITYAKTIRMMKDNFPTHLMLGEESVATIKVTEEVYIM